MNKPYSKLPDFIKYTELEPNAATYLFARLVAEQTPEHIIARLKHKLPILTRETENNKARHSSDSHWVEIVHNQEKGIKKYITLIRYLESLNGDFSPLTNFFK